MSRPPVVTTTSPKMMQPVHVGLKLEVQWPSDNQFYQCSVVDYSIKTTRTKVVYQRNNNAVEDFLLNARVWRIASKTRGRPLLDPIVGKQIELTNDAKLAKIFECGARKLRCYVLRRAGPARYDLLFLQTDRIAYGRNLADVEYHVVDPNVGRADEDIMESLSDDAEPPSSPSHTSEEQSIRARDQELLGKAEISPVTHREDELNLQMPLFVPPPVMMPDANPFFPSYSHSHPDPLTSEASLYQNDFSVEAVNYSSGFDDVNSVGYSIAYSSIPNDKQAAGVEVEQDAVMTGNNQNITSIRTECGQEFTVDGQHSLQATDNERRRLEQAARDAVHRFVSVARRPNEPRSLGYVLGYEEKERAHRVAWIDSVEVTTELMKNDHEFLKGTPKPTKKRRSYEHLSLVHSKKRPRTELTGRWISIQDDPALVVGSRPDKNLVYFPRDERVEEVVLGKTEWAEGGERIFRYEEGGLVGKRIVVLDKSEDGKELLFEAFVLEGVGTAKYRLLYTFTGMMLLEDLRNRDKHWDIVPMDAVEFRGRKIISWSQCKLK